MSVQPQTLGNESGGFEIEIRKIECFKQLEVIFHAESL